MSWKTWAAATVVAAGFLAAGARADDTHRLAMTTADDFAGVGGAVDTIPVHGWRRHRPYAYYNYHYYRYPRYSYYFPRYYYPRYYGFSFSFGYARPYYYYAPPVYYYSTPYYCPISLDVQTYGLPGGNVSYSVTRPRPGPDLYALPRDLAETPAGEGQRRRPEADPSAPLRDGTYRYDGGPDNPVPLPKADPAPAPGTFYTPAAARAVSLPPPPPARGSKFAYPAYGEEPRLTSFAEDRTARDQRAGR